MLAALGTLSSSLWYCLLLWFWSLHHFESRHSHRFSKGFARTKDKVFWHNYYFSPISCWKKGKGQLKAKIHFYSFVTCWVEQKKYGRVGCSLNPLQGSLTPVAGTREEESRIFLFPEITVVLVTSGFKVRCQAEPYTKDLNFIS